MLETGLLAGLAAKLAGLGTAVKAIIAAATATATMTVVAGVAGVIPSQSNASGTLGVSPAAIGPAAPVVGAVTQPAPAASIETGAEAGTEPAGTPAGSESASAGVGIASTPAAPSTPRPVVPDDILPTMAAVPGCMTDLAATIAGSHDPATLATAVPACVRSVIGSLDIPAETSSCLASALTSMTTAAGLDVGGLLGLLSPCLPAGTPVPGMGSFPGMVPAPGTAPASGSGWFAGAGSA